MKNSFKGKDSDYFQSKNSTVQLDNTNKSELSNISNKPNNKSSNYLLGSIKQIDIEKKGNQSLILPNKSSLGGINKNSSIKKNYSIKEVGLPKLKSSNSNIKKTISNSSINTGEKKIESKKSVKFNEPISNFNNKNNNENKDNFNNSKQNNLSNKLETTEEQDEFLSKFNKGNMMVVVRKRPLNARELQYNSSDLIKVVPPEQITVLDVNFSGNKQVSNKNQNYFFDYAFDENSEQFDIYNKTAKYLIPSVMEGYNATILAYGATGCGKTFTMVGCDGNEGIMVRSLAELFILKEKMEANGNEVKIFMTYVEVYNETILDLMVDKSESNPLELYEDSRKNIIINGVTEKYVNNSNEVFKLLE